MTQRFIRSGDVELWSEGAGNPADPPLLLIASDCLSSTGWPDELVGLLVAGGHHVIRYDHRDTGRSTWRDFAEYPYTFTTLTADAVAVLDGWDLQTTHVYGFGMGGGIGQLLALDHPERLATLTVSNCFALGVDFFGNWERALNGEPTPDGLSTPQRWFIELVYGVTAPGPDQDMAHWRAVIGDESYFEAEERPHDTFGPMLVAAPVSLLWL